MAKRTSYAAHKVLHAEEHEDAKQSAQRYASENGLTITEEVTVNYAKLQTETPDGVLSALIAQNKEYHGKAGELLESMMEGGITKRTRGERRRHYNQTMERITRNHALITALIDKNVEPASLAPSVEEVSEPTPEPKKAKAKPKAKAKANPKAKAGNKKTRASAGTSNIPSKTEIRGMKVGDLRKLCIIYNLSEEGNGSQLKARLIENLHTE
jgi:hypothetical protein